MVLPIIERRRIEAGVLKAVYEQLVETHGVEVARDTIDKAVTRSAIAHGKWFRDELGREANLEDFLDTLKHWTAEDALKIDVIEATKETLTFNVVRCRYAEMYHEMGLGHMGDLLSCNRDGQFCVGYNPKIKFKRTQTIMKGADHCDFQYNLEVNEK